MDDKIDEISYDSLLLFFELIISSNLCMQATKTDIHFAALAKQDIYINIFCFILAYVLSAMNRC